MSLLSWRWAPVVGVALAILILVGAFVTLGTGNHLTEPGGRLVYQCVGPDAGLITSVVAGMVATAQDYQTRP